ncbi:unnamed protein product [Meloidogyne enterolobii]|uniref:Uncharacterized protein n=1 Tax=Meloidogyne enterolobii TaxID=390850 RepID=A0ACB0YBS9_MELEN
MSFNKYLKIIILIFASIVALSVATFSPAPNINECNIEIILECVPSLDVSADVDLGITDISAELGTKSSELVSAEVNVGSVVNVSAELLSKSSELLSAEVNVGSVANISVEIGSNSNQNSSENKSKKSSENELLSVEGKLKSSEAELSVELLNLKSAEASNEFLLCKKLKHKKGKHPHHHHNHKGTKKPKKPKKGKTTTAKPKKHTSVTKNPRPCRAILILELIRIKILRLNIHQQVLFIAFKKIFLKFF